MNESARRNGREPTRPVEANGRQLVRPGETNGHVSPRPAGSTNGAVGAESPGTSLVALIQEAEALHTTLGEAKSRTARLIAGLRRHRKHSRLVQDTLRSLRQLRLVEAAE
jgi:hypothetical protein